MKETIYKYHLQAVKSEKFIETTPRIIGSMEASRVFRLIWDTETIPLFESFYTLFLNRANHVIGFIEFSKGGITGTYVDLKLVIGAALNMIASGIIIAHNHPSGSLKPSDADRKLTKEIRQACEFFSIELLDHIILTDSSYYSFADNSDL